MRLGAAAERRLLTFAPPLLVALLTLPFILGQNAWFEWANPYWLLQRQAEHVAGTGLPTLFLHVDTGTFNPFFVYYAGPLLSVLAYPAVLVGPWATFVGATVAAAVAGYLGIWWAAINLGLSRRLATLPALTFSATPYVVSNLYGRGAWAEYVAVNAVAVLLGGLTAILFTARGGRLGAIVAVALSAAVIAGTHNLTLLISAILVPLMLLAVLGLRGPEAPPLGRALARAVAGAALGLGLVAAWLLPNLEYGRDTLAAQPKVNDGLLRTPLDMDRLDNVLSPLPRVPSAFGDHTVYAQAPVLVLLWVVVVFCALAWRRRGSRTAAPAFALVALGAALLVLISQPGWWLHFPAVLRTVQFPFRLVTYLAILTALGVVVALRALDGGRLAGRARVALVAAVAAQLALGAFVAVHSRGTSIDGSASPGHDAIHAYSEPPAFAGATTLTQAQFRVYDRPTVDRQAYTDVTAEIGDPLTSDSASLSGVQPAGALVLVPVAWSPYIQVRGGATLAGRDEQGFAIVSVSGAGPDGRWVAEVTTATPWPLGLGRAISAACALLLLGMVLAAAALRVRRRQDDDTPLATEDPVPAALVK